MAASLTVTTGTVVPETVMDATATQLSASTTLTVYVPAATFARFCEVAPLLHENAYGAVPPVTVSVAVPFARPQVATVEVSVRTGLPVLLTLADVAPVQPFASVTVTE